MAAVLTLLVGAVTLATGWVGWTPRAVIVAAVLVPYLLIVGVGRRRLAPVPLATIGVLVPVVLGAGFAAGSSPAGLPTALRDAVPSLLTAARPAPGTPLLLLPGVLFAALVGTWVGVRACRPRGGDAAPAVGAGALYVAGALLSAGRADPHGILAGLLVLGAAVNWLDRERGKRVRGVTRALPVTVLGIAVATVLVTVVPADRGFEPRDLVVPPQEAIVEPNPLPELPAFAEMGDEVLLRHRGSGLRLHLVSLVAFNGTVWQARTSYRPVGAVVGPGLVPPGNQRREVTTDVTIGALDGPLLPAPGDPTAVSLPDAKMDAETGSLALPAGLRTGLGYQVRSQVDAPEEEQLAVAGVPYVEQYVQVPRLPPRFSQYLQELVRGATTPYEQAVLIEGAVREKRQLAPTAPVGSSYARLEMFLFGQSGEPGAQVGTSEQFATAFAVLARAAGLPTRVVVGFAPGARQPDGTWVVRGRDALAWPEVYFNGLGWVPFEPTPTGAGRTTNADAIRREIEERVGNNQPQPQQAPAKPVGVPTPAPTVSSGLSSPGGPTGSRSYLDSVGVVFGSLLLVGLVLLVASRAVRRMRHRRAGPRGAWSEVLDLLLLLDRTPPRWHTAPRIASDLSRTIPVSGEHPAVRLAAFADRAAFSPAGSGSALPAPWPDLRRLKAAARRTVPWYRRTIWPLDPRPLFRR
jgi:transglutaminase-like putative cysteine protease